MMSTRMVGSIIMIMLVVVVDIMTGTVLVVDVNLIGRACLPGNETQYKTADHHKSLPPMST